MLLLRSSKFYYSLFILSVLVNLLYKFNTRTISLVPRTEFFNCQFYSDSLQNGSSRIDSANYDSTGLSTYLTLYPREKRIYGSYAGFSLTHKKHEFIDLSGYDYLEWEFDSLNTESFTVCLISYVNNYSKEFSVEHVYTYLFSLNIIATGVEKSKYRQDLKKLYTPEWWYSWNKIKKQKPDFSKVRSINIEVTATEGQNAPNIHNKPYYLSIKFFKAKRNMSKHSLFALVLILLPLIIWKLLIFIIQKLLSRKGKIIPYEILNVKNHNDVETERLIIYLHDNCCNEDISLNLVASTTGISKNKIPVLLKKLYNMSFRDYINNLRIQKAKELLQKSEKSITAISLDLGFSYPSSFNRIFKKLVGCSPTQFRDKYRTTDK